MSELKINYNQLKGINNPRVKAVYEKYKNMDNDGAVKDPKVKEKTDGVLYLKETKLSKEQFKEEIKYFNSTVNIELYRNARFNDKNANGFIDEGSVCNLWKNEGYQEDADINEDGRIGILETKCHLINHVKILEENRNNITLTKEDHDSLTKIFDKMLLKARSISKHSSDKPKALSEIAKKMNRIGISKDKVLNIFREALKAVADVNDDSIFIKGKISKFNVIKYVDRMMVDLGYVVEAMELNRDIESNCYEEGMYFLVEYIADKLDKKNPPKEKVDEMFQKMIDIAKTYNRTQGQKMMRAALWLTLDTVEFMKNVVGKDKLREVLEKEVEDHYEKSEIAAIIFYAEKTANIVNNEDKAFEYLNKEIELCIKANDMNYAYKAIVYMTMFTDVNIDRLAKLHSKLLPNKITDEGLIKLCNKTYYVGVHNKDKNLKRVIELRKQLDL